MPDDLYRRDVVAWAEAQAARLRRVAAGERVNDVDWENVIEEIESVGRSQVDGVESLLFQALVHAMKINAWPDHSAARKWRNEIGTFLVQAQDRYAASMARQLDVARILRSARRAVLALDMGRPRRPLPETTGLTLAELTDEAFGAEALIARVAAGAPPAA